MTELSKVQKVSMQGDKLRDVCHGPGSVQKLLNSAFERNINCKKRPSRCGEKCPSIKVQLGKRCEKSSIKSARIDRITRSWARFERLLKGY